MRGWVARWGRAPGANWRNVPRINLLEGEGRGHRWVVGAGLTLLLLGGVYPLLSLHEEGTTQQRELNRSSSRLKATQTELASRSDEVGRLEAQLRDLQARRQQRLPQQRGSERWQAALASLERLQGDGVRLWYVRGSAGGELMVMATATAVQPLARLHARIQEMDQLFELQGVQWKQEGEALTLTATLLVKASP